MIKFEVAINMINKSGKKTDPNWMEVHLIGITMDLEYKGKQKW